MESAVIDGLKQRHKNIFSLLFQRSVEHAETTAELFDILEELPPYPVMWNEEKRRWVHVQDVTLSHRIKLLKGS